MSLDAKSTIETGKAILGIEFGSTRIKAVLIDQDNTPIAQGSHEWENQLVDGFWTYSTEAIWYGLQDCYANLRENVKKLYDTEIEVLAAIGVSAMMHGYMAFNMNKILVPFRTWRNTNTAQAAAKLSELFIYNIPLRWSISHLYQAILDNEEHVKDIDYLTTLAGYVHWQLTNNKVLGMGDASGMIPVDTDTKNYSATMVEKFDKLVSPKKFAWKLTDILPKILVAGENAGFLTEDGAKRIDVSGHLKPGIPFCPPEGDAGTGMVATNAIKQRTGNVSAGTSSFSIILAATINSPISVMETAGEGGAWGIALLASYLVNNQQKEPLADFLEKVVFAGDTGVEISPTVEEVAGFNKYIDNYKVGLAIEKTAIRFNK